MRCVCSALLALSLLGSCGAEDAPSERHEITGSVRDARSAAPIAKADVRFVSDTLDEAGTTSDGDGRFSLQVDVREGVIFGTVRATRDGYGPSTARSVYFDGLPVVVELELAPLAPKASAR